MRTFVIKVLEVANVIASRIESRGNLGIDKTTFRHKLKFMDFVRGQRKFNFVEFFIICYLSMTQVKTMKLFEGRLENKRLY